MKSILLAVLLVTIVSANHFAYIGFFSSSNCNGDPYAVTPIYPGDAQFCPDPFEIDGTRDVSDTNNFVSFLNFFTTDCNEHLELRVPIFEGTSELCYESAGTTCTGVLRGFTLPNSGSVECPNSVWSLDDCDVTVVDNSREDYTFGTCG